MVEFADMSLNIKNDKAHRLAREVADRTGRSMTAVVTDALREKLERLDGASAADREKAILRVAAATAPLLRDADLDHGSLLYDDQGLPR
jgi:antitoxin VapB